MRKTIIRIVRVKAAGTGVVARFENRAAAHYYLALIAANINTQLETITTDCVYAIDGVSYLFQEVTYLTIEDVNRLRRRHEPGFRSPLQLAAAGEHDLEVRLPQDTSYGSLDSWP